MSEVEVLLSTQNRKSQREMEELLQEMKVTTRATIVNQTERYLPDANSEQQPYYIQCRKEKGLSKSRNQLLELQRAEIGMLADDDLVYELDYEKTVKQAYEEHPEADLIAFYVESTNAKRPVRKQKTHKINWVSAMRIYSFQITIRKGINLRFDENFGAGTKKLMGEEAIFLYDCLKQHKKLYYIDKKIAKVKQEQSSWFTGYQKEYFKAEGAVFYRITPKLYQLLILQYAIRKRKLYKKETKMWQAIHWMQQGAKEYKEEKNGKSKYYHSRI